MKIVLDNIIFDLQKSGGISVVWYELISRLQHSAFELQYLDNPQTKNYLRQNLTIPHEHIRNNKYPSLTRAFPVKIKECEPFIFQSSYYRYCTSPNSINITIVHDFTNELFATGIKKHIHTWQKFRALRHSDYIVCISESTKRDLLKFLPDIQEEHVRVIYNGVSNDYHELTDSDKGAHMSIPFPPHSYILFVGNRASYKNFELVHKSLKTTAYNLVIVGPSLTKEEKQQLEKNIPPERYKSLGFIPNKELNTLYNHAACLAYPSSYEGFGIPILEAQKAGCPVIAYPHTSIPEVLGESPLALDNLSETEFIRKLQILKDKKQMDKVRAMGVKNAKRFTWDAMYQSYCKLYEEIEQTSKQ